MALIAITGLGSDEDKVRAGAAGFDLHLTKPAESSEIERAFAELASGNRR